MLSTVPLQLYCGDPTRPDRTWRALTDDMIVSRRSALRSMRKNSRRPKSDATPSHAAHSMQRFEQPHATVGTHSPMGATVTTHSEFRALPRRRQVSRDLLCHSANQSVTVCAAITVRRAGRRSHCSAPHSVTLAVRSARWAMRRSTADPLQMTHSKPSSLAEQLLRYNAAGLVGCTATCLLAEGESTCAVAQHSLCSSCATLAA
jgi:hypothetical protein